MADVIVSKIQHRRGLRRDLPQPLDPGELGYCIDTGQVFIGAESYEEDQNALHSLSVVLYDNDVNSENTANFYISEHISQFSGLGPYDNDEEAFTAFSAITNLPPEQIRVVYTGFDGIYRGYAGYFDSFEAGVPVSVASGQSFDNGSLDLQLSSTEYVLGDSYAIAELTNLVNGDGIVTTHQNVEMLTDFSDLDNLSNPRVEQELPGNADGSEVEALQYDLVNDDSFVIEYSMYDKFNNIYSRVGRLKIVTQNGTAMLLDDYSEIVEGNNIVVIDFTSTVDLPNGKVNVLYTSSGIPDGIELIFVTNTRKWKSF